MINMHHLHHNKDEWIEPDRYIPERFDPSSKYYLTPSGKKRSPMSFSPFLGGKRVCLGKTFADLVSKVVAPSILHNFEFSFVDPEQAAKKPLNNVNLTYLPKILVNAKSRVWSQTLIYLLY